MMKRLWNFIFRKSAHGFLDVRDINGQPHWKGCRIVEEGE